MSIRIDAHQHFWSLRRGDYGWLTSKSGSIYRDFVPADLIPLLMRNGIDKTILVQAAPTESETHFMLGLAEVTPFIAGVVGWVDLAGREAVWRVADLARNKLLVGLRPMVQDLPDPKWLARQDLAPALDAMADAGLVFDALVLPQHLAALTSMAVRHPELTIIIDHVAKPHLRGGIGPEFWDDLAELARLPHCFCKLSGLLTEAPRAAGIEFFQPLFKKVHHLFGSERLLWGSDWPVVTLAASYDEWFAMAYRLMSGCASHERDAMLGGNAKKVYLSGRGRAV